MMAANAGPEPVVSVIVATYNRSSALRWALSSLLAQDFAAFEAWVVGDACTDDSEAVVRSFADSRLRWVNLGRNSGSQARPNNVGLRAARGRYVAYLGHDDLWLPWHLSGLIARIEATGADFVHALCALIGPEGTRECVGPPRPGVTYREHVVPPSCWLHRRELLAACGPWSDPDRLAWPVDYDYSRRVYLAGKAMVFHPELTVLKFPSWWFARPYASREASLQETYWHALRADPARVERGILLELAITSARARATGYEPSRAAFRRAFRSLLYETTARIGLERPPLSALSRWWFQRQRRARRVQRGLSMEASAPRA
jgi:glycosyltransferase involved in cell wall biosynthesis